MKPTIRGAGGVRSRFEASRGTFELEKLYQAAASSVCSECQITQLDLLEVPRAFPIGHSAIKGGDFVVEVMGVVVHNIVSKGRSSKRRVAEEMVRLRQGAGQGWDGIVQIQILVSLS